MDIIHLNLISLYKTNVFKLLGAGGICGIGVYLHLLINITNNNSNNNNINIINNNEGLCC